MGKIVIYTIDNCGFCISAKNLLKQKDLSFIEKNLSGKDDEKLELLKKTNHRTFPQIFIGDQFIGGFMELDAHFKSKD